MAGILSFPVSRVSPAKSNRARPLEKAQPAASVLFEWGEKRLSLSLLSFWTWKSKEMCMCERERETEKQTKNFFFFEDLTLRSFRLAESPAPN